MQRSDFIKVELERNISVLDKYDDVSFAFENLYLVRSKETGLYGLINIYLQEIIPCEYSRYDFNKIIADKRNLFSENKYGLRRLYKQDCLCGYKDPNGELVIPLIYEKAFPFSDNLACVKKEEAWGFIYPSGHVAIPFNYERAKSFVNGLAPVKINGKWGYINKNNQLVIDPIYDEAQEFRFGYALVRLKDKYFFINQEGIPLVKKLKEVSFISKLEDIPEDTININILTYLSLIEFDLEQVIIQENDYQEYLKAILEVETKELLDKNLSFSKHKLLKK